MKQDQNFKVRHKPQHGYERYEIYLPIRCEQDQANAIADALNHAIAKTLEEQDAITAHSEDEDKDEDEDEDDE